jgi:hypothetical protein
MINLRLRFAPLVVAVAVAFAVAAPSFSAFARAQDDLQRGGQTITEIVWSWLVGQHQKSR